MSLPVIPRSRAVLLGLVLGLASLAAGGIANADRRDAAVAGLLSETRAVGGIERSWYIALPAGSEGQTGLPAVLVFHGGEGDGRDAAASSRMAAAAQTQGFVAVFPSSGGTQWNDGRTETATGPDDVAFVRALVDDLVARQGIDPARVFIAGVSNGGMFVERLACDAPDLFRAGAVVAATMPADLAATCAPARPLPLIFFNGTDDRLMPFEGGEIASLRLLGIGVGGTVLSQSATRDFWASAFGCSAPGAPQALPDIADDGTTVARQDIGGCRDGADLAFLTITGGGHNWPGSGPGRRFAGTVSADIDATAEMLAFFTRHGL